MVETIREQNPIAEFVEAPKSPKKAPTPAKKAATRAHKDYESKRASRNGKAAKPAPAKASPVKKDGPTPGERKAELVRVLRKVKAVGAGNAKSLRDLGEKMGIEPREVYNLVSGGSGKAGSSPTCLLATGHVKVASLAGEGLAVYLTKKGQETKFDERPFVREAK